MSLRSNWRFGTCAGRDIHCSLWGNKYGTTRIRRSGLIQWRQQRKCGFRDFRGLKILQLKSKYVTGTLEYDSISYIKGNLINRINLYKRH